MRLGLVKALLPGLGALAVSACWSGEPSHTGIADPLAPVTSSSPTAVVAPPAIAPALSAPAPLPAASAMPSIEGMALVPAGPFTMGADEGGELDEHPAHTVTLEAFYLDLTEVTNEAYRACVREGLCPPPDPRNARSNHVGPDKRFRRPKQPASSLAWDSARAYCLWVGKRLPTEAEWEKAARGPDARQYPWGNEDPTPDRGVFAAGVTSDVGAHPAGAGPYGHLDLAGNVWEWVEDIYDPYAYQRSGAAEGKGGICEEALSAFAEIRSQRKQGFTGSNPVPTECEHVLRGGAFNYRAPGLRSSNRVHHPGRFHLVMSGFRCARDAVE
jgi:formylglycine-generating enzyme required for sulfatase activity